LVLGCIFSVARENKAQNPQAGDGSLTNDRSASIDFYSSPQESVHEAWYFDHVRGCAAVLRHQRVDDRQSMLQGETYRQVDDTKENYPVQLGELGNIRVGTDQSGNPFVEFSGPTVGVWEHYARTVKHGWEDPRFTDRGSTSESKTLFARLTYPGGTDEKNAKKAQTLTSVLQSLKAQCAGQTGYIDSHWLSEALEVQMAPLPVTSTSETTGQLRSELDGYVNGYTNTVDSSGNNESWRHLEPDEVNKLTPWLKNQIGSSLDDSYLVPSPCVLWLQETQPYLSLYIVRLADVVAPGIRPEDETLSEIETRLGVKSILSITEFDSSLGSSYNRNDTNDFFIAFTSPKISRKFDKAMFFLVRNCADAQPSAP
jgi:hypothetical protein